MQGFTPAPKRGNYKLAERLFIKRKIYQMILDGYTYAKIMDELQLEDRTFHRYLNAIFAEEQSLLTDVLGGREEMRRQIIICRDRLLEDRRQVWEWVQKDPKFQPRDKLDGMNLIAELDASLLRLYEYGPAYLSKYDNSLPNSQRYYNNNSLTDKRDDTTTTPRLVLKKPEDEEQQQKYKKSPREVKEEAERWR